MSAITDLQDATNRFASLGFSATFDGNLVTIAPHLIAALNWIHTNLDGESNTAGTLLTSVQNADGSPNIAQITSSAAGLAYFVNSQADMGGMPAAPVNVLGLGIPSWILYAGGAVALLGIGLLVYNKSKHSSSTAMLP